MASNGIPLRFTIHNQDKVASTQAADFCSWITFNPEGIVPATAWSAIPVENGFYAFQESNTGCYATAVDGRIRACPSINQQGQSSFNVVRNNDGSYLVQLNTAHAIWEVKSDGSLGLGAPIAKPENTFYFVSA